MISPERSHCFSYKRFSPEELKSMFGAIEGENSLENRVLRGGAGVLLAAKKGETSKHRQPPQGDWSIEESGPNVRIIAGEKILDWLESGIITTRCFKSRIPKE